VGKIEVGGKDVLKVFMKRLYNMLVQSWFLKLDAEYHLHRGDHCEFHERKGHHIKDCIEFYQKVARMLTIRELRIKAMEGSNEVRMMKKIKRNG